jgi:hypothetical protein
MARTIEEENYFLPKQVGKEGRTKILYFSEKLKGSRY